MLHQLTRHLLKYSETPALDAQTLLAHIHQKNTAWVLAHPNAPLNQTQLNTFKKSVLQLQKGIPLPYVIGQWEFFGIDFIVTPDVLIPRPETEELVEKALDYLRTKPDAHVLDMGTGSGCIPISLARSAPRISLVAVDRSDAALNIARQNAAKHKVAERFTFIESNLFSNVKAFQRLNVPTFDLITANLPYIPTETLKTLDVYTREPSLALDGGLDGLDLVRRFLQDAPHFLAPNGMMLLEIDSSHGPKALETAKEFFPKATCKLLQDLSRRDRFIRIQTF